MGAEESPIYCNPKMKFFVLALIAATLPRMVSA